MKFSLQKIPRLSGHRASIYTIWSEDDEETLFEQFSRENITDFPDEVNDILQRLHTIGHKTGAREQYFKLNEGNIGDGVCALYDNPDKNLRLYCIRNGTVNIILGGGGEKPKPMIKLQESDKLKDENYFLRAVSKLILERIKEREIRYSKNDMDLEGNLIFEDTDLKY
jgi:hypothetical protein